MSLKLVILIFSSKLFIVESAKILSFYPTPSISHQVVFRKLTLELIKQGHEVTVITPDPEYAGKKAPKNLTEIDVHDISYSILRKTISEWTKGGDSIQNKLSDGNHLPECMRNIFEVQIQDPQVKKILLGDKKQFDLILIEELSRLPLALSHIFDAPVILFSSFGGFIETHYIFGSHTHPILYPSPLLHQRLYNLTCWEKAKNIYSHYKSLYYSYVNEDIDNKLINKYFGPDTPPISDLYQNVQMIFLNIHHIWIDNQPVPSNIVYLGGLHQKEPAELPEDLKKYLNSSKHGVIYVSFGTNALSTVLQLDKVKIIAQVLGQLQYDVIWKWDQDELPGRSENIKLSKWLPQADLLRHPKLKLFITQAGLQSTDEAITAGVPLLGFPVLGDQWYNAEKYILHGIGDRIFFEEVDEDKVKTAIERIIADESYRKNIIELRKIMEDQPQAPLQRAVFWVNYVLRHKKSKHMRAAGAHLSWAQYFEIECLLFLFSVLILLIALLAIFIYYLYYHVVKKMLIVTKFKQN